MYYKKGITASIVAAPTNYHQLSPFTRLVVLIITLFRVVCPSDPSVGKPKCFLNDLKDTTMPSLRSQVLRLAGAALSLAPTQVTAAKYMVVL